MLVNTCASMGQLLDASLDRARQDLSPSTVRTTTSSSSFAAVDFVLDSTASVMP
jgi:hypothetical protein